MILGIDLGTSNSLICRIQDGQAVPIPNAHGEVLTPSVVAIDETGTLLVGAAAREHMATRPLHAQAAFKRHMGANDKLRLGEQSFRPEGLFAQPELVVGSHVAFECSLGMQRARGHVLARRGAHQ